MKAEQEEQMVIAVDHQALRRFGHLLEATIVLLCLHFFFFFFFFDFFSFSTLEFDTNPTDDEFHCLMTTMPTRRRKRRRRTDDGDDEAP